MQAAFSRWFEQLIMLVDSRSERKTTTPSEPDLIELIRQARQEWVNMDRYFDSVSDPELIDHAILLRQAAEKKYMYMMKLAKAEGLRAFSPGLLTGVTGSAEVSLGGAVTAELE